MGISNKQACSAERLVEKLADEKRDGV